jgi:hypothetical protein
MTPDRIVKLLVVAAIAALGVWIASNTYWEDVTIKEPAQGAAAANPFYGLQHLAMRLGIRTQFVATLAPLPPRGAVLVVGDFQSDPLRTPIESLERWISGGGRVVIGSAALHRSPAFQAWSGISPEPPEGERRSREETPPRRLGSEECESVAVRSNGAPTGIRRSLCVPVMQRTLASRRPPVWAAESGELGLQMLRVQIGRGAVTVVPQGPFLVNRGIVKGDHAQLLLESADLQRGDHLYIHYADRTESLGAMLWRLMAPALVCACIAALLLIARHLPRFGPPLPAAPAVRRSLAEQLRANAAFAWRTGRLGALRRAVRRSLDETAARHIPAYAAMSSRQRAGAIAALTHADVESLFAAMTRDATAGMRIQRTAIAVLEQARRMLKNPMKKPRGNEHER